MRMWLLWLIPVVLLFHLKREVWQFHAAERGEESNDLIVRLRGSDEPARLYDSQAAPIRQFLAGSARPAPAETGGSQGVAAGALPIDVDVAAFHKLGFVYVRKAFPTDIVDNFASKIDAYVRNSGKLAHEFAGGTTVANFLIDPYLAEIFGALHGNERVHAALRQIFGDQMGTERGQYRFLSHNDIGVNIKSTWHKDRLSGIYRGYETRSPWSVVDGEEMRILKVGMYLQDHSNPWDHSCLRVLAGSHTSPKIPADKFNISFLHPSKGDVLIFDQRITHGGQGKISDKDHIADDEVNTTGDGEILVSPGQRIMVTLGYGWNNRHSDDFELGTNKRQKYFHSPYSHYNAYSKAALKFIQKDFRKRGIQYKCDKADICP